jgi:PKD repeat protein
MTAAKQYSRCLEDRTHGIGGCPGVYLGNILGFTSSKYVHGMPFGQRHFIVRSAGDRKPWGVNIVDVTTPTNPVAVTSGFAGIFTAGVAMWSQGSTAYLAVRTSTKVNILDVTACLTSGCATLPAPYATFTVAPVSESDVYKTVDFSRSGGTPMLFIGNHDLCHSGESLVHTEYVLDLSNPAVPRDITPPGTIVDLGETVDYWSWYYSDLVRGFSTTAPRGGKFNGPYLYRADLSLFDVHKWTGSAASAPVASFTWSPIEVYAGDSVAFSDTSQGNVTSRAWTFQDGTPSAGAVPAPSPAQAAQAAGTGVSQLLAGLRQDAQSRSTVWIFNMGGGMAQYDVIYRDPSGRELGRIADGFLAAGKMQQLGPAQHKLPAAAMADGFTVQVLVKSGKILATAQVVNDATKSSAYIQGVTR